MNKDEVLKMLSRSGLLFVGYNLKASDLRLFEFSNLVNDHIEEMVNLRLEQAIEAEREEEFDALVEAAVIEQGYRKCAEGQKTTQFCGMLEGAVLAEREECAKVCGRLADEALVVGDEDAVMCFEEAENAIRARGKHER
jgi:hypothetical protein